MPQLTIERHQAGLSAAPGRNNKAMEGYISSSNIKVMETFGIPLCKYHFSIETIRFLVYKMLLYQAVICHSLDLNSYLEYSHLLILISNTYLVEGVCQVYCMILGYIR